ncbi:MAG: enoyl-CoA hydratase/isomerase family protein [Acidobacteria bacterium]|nr:enoyl-CoA hydratase/isomerase family protein [Acidobacteriota bacterium]
MMEYRTIRYEQEGTVARVRFCRPETHNAFNTTMIEELLDLFGRLKDAAGLRVVVLTGEGRSFCAGADLNWMRAVRDYSFDQNLGEALRLAALFRLIYEFPKPVIGRINGAAIGGGTGFVAVADIAIAAEEAVFSFSEVKIGVVPACISPYVVRRVGEGRTREFFLTGERLTAGRALAAGLVNRVVAAGELDQAVDQVAAQLVSSGPEALAVCKRLLGEIAGQDLDEAERYTAEMLARLRGSPEAQEGMDAFLGKRKPRWAEP